MIGAVLRWGVVWCLLAPVTAGAAAWQAPDRVGGWARFAAGMAGTLAVHEGGHFLVAAWHAQEVKFDGTTVVYPNIDLTRTEHIQVSSAGFQTQWLLSEAVLRHHEAQGPRHRMGPLAAGAVAGHLMITAAYVVRLKTHPDGDLTAVAELTDISRAGLTALITVPALLDGWRLLGKTVPRWVPNLALGVKGAALLWIWQMD